MQPNEGKQSSTIAEIPGYHILLEGLLENIQLDFSDLETGALGSASENTIALDTTANGYGWHVDLSPGANEEFLLTSDLTNGKLGRREKGFGTAWFC